MEKENVVKRESNWELLRVLAMSVIILNHVASLSGILDGVTFNGNIMVSLFSYSAGSLAPMYL